MAEQFAGNNWSVGAVAAPAFALELTTVACFAEGTRIGTPDGLVPVEALRAGDLVLSHFGGVVPVRWVGSRRARTAGMADPARVWPIRIEAGRWRPGCRRRRCACRRIMLCFSTGCWCRRGCW
jgi:hypothetical protein